MGDKENMREKYSVDIDTDTRPGAILVKCGNGKRKRIRSTDIKTFKLLKALKRRNFPNVAKQRDQQIRQAEKARAEEYKRSRERKRR